MIKKTITVLSILVLSTALIWAVWEGNAAAGSKEDFPSGLFASSDLFPKYTLIEVTNLEQNTTSRAVIIGNTGADGVLVKVSPDLAAALLIREGSTVRVRVSVPPLVAEEGADPVLLSKVNNEELRNKETVQSEPAPPEVSEPVQPVPAESEKKAEPIIVTEVKPAQPETGNAPSKEEILPIDEVFEPIQPEPETASAPLAVAEVTAPTDLLVRSEPSAEYAMPVQKVSEITVPEESTGTNTSEDPIQEVLSPSEPQPEAYSELPVKEITPIEAPPAEDMESTDDVVEIAAIKESEPGKDTKEPVLIAAESAAVDETESEVEDPIDESENEVLAEDSMEPQDEPELFTSAEAVPEEDNSKDEAVESYAVLVPSEPREPLAEDLPISKEPEKSAPATRPSIAQPAEESYTTASLKKGLFYVQIGRFKDMLNVESFVQLYGEKYPVAVEKFPAAKSTDVFYKVYIGPLHKDEQGAALETFKKLGFKDAFLKKAP